MTTNQENKTLADRLYEKFPIEARDNHGYYIKVNPELVLDFIQEELARREKEIRAEYEKDIEVEGDFFICNKTSHVGAEPCKNCTPVKKLIYKTFTPPVKGEKVKEMNKTETKRDYKLLGLTQAEEYFIQFLFFENRALLGYEYKELYKAMLDAYTDVYEAGKKAGVDLMNINAKYKAIL